MGKKLKASDVIEIDDKFINQVAEAMANSLSVDKNYTTAEVAIIASSSPKTIRKHIRKGLLKATYIGRSYRINKKDLDNYLKP